MYYIDDYKKRAIDKIIPYLVDFPQIVKIIENSADRYQAIEDLLWNIATNFKVTDSRGIFLDAHAKNEVIDITYTDKAEDAFTYGTDKPLYQAYGTGHYYSQASYISGIKKNVSEDKLIRAVQAKIIQNNTNCTIEDLIEGLKLLYNAKSVKIYESNPLNISIMLSGNELELSSSGNYENIKKMLGNCVSLKNIYINPHQFDLFLYDKNSSYGESRYPIKLNETIDSYYYISQSVNLDSEFEEFITTNHNKFDNNMFCCITGAFTLLNDEAVLFSSVDTLNHNIVKIGIKYGEDGEAHLFSMYNDEEKILNSTVNLNKRYTIVAVNDNSKFKVWLFDNVLINGSSLDSDQLKILNKIVNIEPSLVIDDYFTVEAPISINCEQGTGLQSNFADFTYYAIMFGNVDLINQKITSTEYYASCYGEKQILFNCLENKNHLYINTNNPLLSNIMTKQNYYNYKSTHSNGKYMYLDGKSNIDYYNFNEDIPCNIIDMDISFDICMPINIQNGTIISGLVNNENQNSKIYIDEITLNNKTIKTIALEHTYYDTNNNEIKAKTFSNIELEPDKFINIKIKYKDNIFYFYKNNSLVNEQEITFNILNMPKITTVGSDKLLSNFYKGFIKDINIEISGIDGDVNYKNSFIIPYSYNLKSLNSNLEYTNFGARFITTPQLIDDTKNLDLYGNNLIGVRN